MHRRFTEGGHYWKKAEPLVVDGVEGEDAWIFRGPGQMSVIVSYDPDTEPGVEWIHASVAYGIRQRFPSYNDLKRMHHGVFGDGHAYQFFVPAAEHISITDNVLHLFGRLDGKPVLPDFGWQGTI
jgi:hypothetical protein